MSLETSMRKGEKRITLLILVFVIFLSNQHNDNAQELR